MEKAILLSEVVSALSLALDLTEGQPMGHSIRSCILAMRIGQELQLGEQQLSDLYYASLLKDSGCSANSARLHKILSSDEITAKREVKLQDWTKVSLEGLSYAIRNVSPNESIFKRIRNIIAVGRDRERNNMELISARCERGAEIARKLGLSEATALSIHALDEHWNGAGYAEALKGEEIPLLARIMNVSQTMEVFFQAHGPERAAKVLRGRSGTWFDPAVVRAAAALERERKLWETLRSAKTREAVLRLEPGRSIPASAERIDSLCEAFAGIVDAKSPFTFQHSVGVTRVAVNVAQQMALSAPRITMIRRAALLHDIGKLGVPNSILDKPGKLDDREWESMKKHPVYTRQILERISGFQELAFVAGAHHERLDGTGYPDRLNAQQLTLPARIIAVADVFQALSEKRAYRDGLPTEVVLSMMSSDAPNRIDADCFDALKRCSASSATQEKSMAQYEGRSG